ncbi:MAG: sulfatase-like hydrolase/transferase [Rubripirellula sp.]|nr:sulfatase-like hydrolase/transferase [Rubripirellula sp.]
MHKDSETADKSAEKIIGSRLSVILCAVLICFWAIEILVVQEFTSRPDGTLGNLFLLKCAARRLVLNLLACTALVYLLNRLSLYGVFLAGLGSSIALVAYAGYFGRPLSWMTISNQWYEGLSYTGYGMATVSWPIALFICFAFIIKLAVGEAIRRHPPTRAFSRTAAGLAGVAYLAAAVGLAGFYKPVTRINIGQPEYIYGYSVAWATEYLTYDAETVLANAIAKSKIKSHLLTEEEQPLDFGENIVVIQVESLDFDVVDAISGNEQVMPFLHDLRQQSMYYMIEPFHDTGSSDADFSLLTSSAPNGSVAPFQVHGFPYGQSLPWVLKDLGYSTVALHGNTGAFFHRRPSYEQMGFSELYFEKELSQQGVNGDLDDEVFRFSANLINESTVPTFHFIITLTSHGPFRQLPPDAERLTESSRTLPERYINNMRYVDRCLQAYYEQLPSDTTILIYGDHHSAVNGYVQGDAQVNRVPWIICQKGKNLADRQRTQDSGLATSGELGQLEMVCFLRDSLESKVAIAKLPEAEPSKLK